MVTFIEDNWLSGQRLGNGSYDAISGSLDAPGGVLDFHIRPHFTPLILNPTRGKPVFLPSHPSSRPAPLWPLSRAKGRGARLGQGAGEQSARTTFRSGKIRL